MTVVARRAELRGADRGLKPTASEGLVYHVWFSTKQRKWLLQGDVVETAKRVIGQVARDHEIDLMELELMPDHAHLLLGAEPATQLSWFLKLLKGRSAFEVFKAYPELKIDAHTNSLWQDGFESRMVPPDQISIVRRYIQTQDERLENYER
jgi:putative transposase